MLRFNEVKKQLKRGLMLKRGIPDARYVKGGYKYTLYYTNNLGVRDVFKTLQEVLDSNNNYECDIEEV